MNIQILRINSEHNTMLIKWPSGVVLNHFIPERIKYDLTLTCEEICSILIEEEKPEGEVI